MKSTDARLDLRLDPDIKQLASRASALSGARSLSEFVIQAVREKALRVMEEAETLKLNNQAFDAFWQACETAPAPNAALRAAARRRKQRIEHGELTTEHTPDRPA
jgi:uncharacterized protein (DUF1778 family)